MIPQGTDASPSALGCILVHSDVFFPVSDALFSSYILILCRVRCYVLLCFGVLINQQLAQFALFWKLARFSVCVSCLSSWETLLDRIARHGCSRALWDQTDRQYFQVIIISSIYLPFISKCLYCIQGELMLLIRGALPICDHRLRTSRWCLLYFFFSSRQWENNENLHQTSSLMEHNFWVLLVLKKSLVSGTSCLYSWKLWKSLDAGAVFVTPTVEERVLWLLHW